MVKKWLFLYISETTQKVSWVSQKGLILSKSDPWLSTECHSVNLPAPLWFWMVIFHQENTQKLTFFVHHQNHSETLSDGPKWSCHIKKWSLYISLRFLEIFLRKMVQSWLFRSTAVGSNFAKKGSSYCCFLRPFTKKMHFKTPATPRSEAKRSGGCGAGSNIKYRLREKASAGSFGKRW